MNTQCKRSPVPLCPATWGVVAHACHVAINKNFKNDERVVQLSMFQCHGVAKPNGQNTLERISLQDYRFNLPPHQQIITPDFNKDQKGTLKTEL